MLADKFLQLKKNKTFYPPVSNCSIFIQASGWNSYRFLNKFSQDRTSHPMLVLNKDRKSFWCIYENKARATAEEVFAKYLENQKVFSDIIEEYKQFQNKIENSFQRLNYNYINSASYFLLFKEINVVWNALWDLNSIAWFSIVFDKRLCEKIIKDSNFIFSREELDKIWERGITPSAPSFDKEQKKYFLELVISGIKLDEIVERCQYFYASYYDVKNLEIVKKRLQEDYGRFSQPRSAQAELAREKKNEDRIATQHQQWFRGLNKKEKILVDYFQKIIWLRDNRKNNIFMGLTLLWRIAERMFHEAGLDEKYIPYYSYQEMKKGLAYLKKNREEIKKRAKGVACLSYYNGHLEISCEDFDKNLKIIEKARIAEFNFKNQKIITGATGAKGQAKGVAKIILNAGKADSFQSGDILVTGMTRPEFVPLMKKAAAIITDEGGITCHAAVVSRELGVPCVIGTRFATKIIKTGQRVEVNANKGVIKILKK